MDIKWRGANRPENTHAKPSHNWENKLVPPQCLMS